MSINEGSDRPTPKSPRIAWSPEGFAYVPRRLLVRGDEAARHLDAVTQKSHDRSDLGARDEAPESTWWRVDGVDDPLASGALLRADGFAAAPDHVFFAHSCGCCGPHPSLTFDALLGDPLHGNPLHGNPLHGNPLHGNPLHGNPLHGNPFIVDPLHGNVPQISSARPAAARAFPVRSLSGPGAHPRITVLDTGLATGQIAGPLLGDPKVAARVTGDAEQPDNALTQGAGKSAVTWQKDGYLDPIAGHGTFIAGLIEQLAPGCTVRVGHVLEPLGDATESTVHKAILEQANLPASERPDILSLSFGGTALAEAPALKTAITKAQLAGIVIVASAGNAASCEPQYPAAYDGVIAVGALGPDGPTPWTNYGEWVDACAPGVNLVSAFFRAFDGPEPRINTEDADHFDGWATWSGTSFSTPVAVAALAREMVLGACSAKDAVTRVVQAPQALQIRGLGAVISA